MRQLLIILFTLLLTSCGVQYQISTLGSDGIYESDDMYPIYLEVPQDTKVDTINNLFQLKRKLRTDFNFRWDFAQYAMNQPLSWYYNNPRLDGIWRPYNRFDVYFHSHQFWTDWAWNYPWYGYDHPWWVRNHRYYNWYYPHPQGWYGWNHYSYSWYNQPLIASNNNYSFVVGRRGSRNLQMIDNSNIENTISRRYNNPNRKDIINSNLNNIVNDLRDNYNVKPRVYSNPNNIPNDVSNGIRLRNDGTRVNINTPRYNNNANININSSRPVYNNSSNISRGSSSSVRSSGGSSSGGSSRGSRGNN
jgi:uncharacterized membrane protein YgcG